MAQDKTPVIALAEHRHPHTGVIYQMGDKYETAMTNQISRLMLRGFIAVRDTYLAEDSKEELQEKADALNLEIQGTGSGGRVLKTDLVAALAAIENDEGT